ncbi:MAG: hypothetical protein U0872_05135 [Planctomycetaceae bacterium]
MSKAVSSARVVSMDQFRGYTVAGMILVNFIGSFAVIHAVFRHNNTFLSYADTIMPGFHFAVGFSYRLTMLKRLQEMSWMAVYWSYLKRCFVLMFLSIMLFGIGEEFKKWEQFEKTPDALLPPKEEPTPLEQLKKGYDEATKKANEAKGALDNREAFEKLSPEEQEKVLAEAKVHHDAEQVKKAAEAVEAAKKRRDSWKDPAFRKTFFENWRVWIAQELKAGMWETFAIIGATQLVILPLVARSFWVRVIAMFAMGIGHAFLCYWFNWGFILGYRDNWMVELWKTGTSGSWDGGFFGPLSWSVAMLAGTIAYDLVMADTTRQKVALRLGGWGVGLMVLGYLLSCPTRLYDIGDGTYAPAKDPKNGERALSPVIPSFDSLGHRSVMSLLAEPPFVAPPPASERLQNYWMMSKKYPTLSFILSASGFSFLAYAVFVWLCDVWGLQLGIFRTFGLNPLLAYCIHEMIAHQLHKIMPRDAPLWYCVGGFILFFWATYACIRYLEKRNIFVRL